MKKLLMSATVRSMNKLAFTILGCALLMFVAAPAWADLCSTALPVGSATGCGAVITVTSVDANGNANAFSVASTGNGNPYDGDEDTLIGVQNNSGATLNTMTLTSSAHGVLAIFNFDGDGPCQYAKSQNGNAGDCFGPYGYEGPNNAFINISEDHTSGTVSFFTVQCDDDCTQTPGLGAGAGTWLALEGTPNSLTLISESQMLPYTPSNTPQTQTASFGSGPSAHTAAYTLNTVINPLNVTVTANYVDTDLSTGMTGIGIADGVCEFGSPSPRPDNDIDCRLADGGFVFATLPNGDQLVPHCIPSHNNQCVWYRANTTGVAGVDYTGPVNDVWTFTTNPSLNPSPNMEYTPGWNNLNGRVYDRPGINPLNPFVADITDYFDGEPNAKGHQGTLNDWLLAAVPNGIADTEETLVPFPASLPPHT